QLGTPASSSTAPQLTAAQINAAGEKEIKRRPKALVDYSIEISATGQAFTDLMAKGQAGAAARTRQLEKIYEADKAQFAEVCVRAIITTTKADADKALLDIKGGTDFITEARKVSVDSTSSDGTPTCIPMASAAQVFGNSIATATVGTVVGPAVGNGGAYVLGQVASFTTAPFSQARSQIESSVPAPGTTEAQAAYQRLLKTVKVSVDPRYGSWNRADGKVDPPAGAATTTTTSTPATAAPG
ncbi:MAG TPA: hypothetical protein VGM93_14590, partial [Acidimicrobiales bacterium]